MLLVVSANEIWFVTDSRPFVSEMDISESDFRSVSLSN